jgi:hypothetical protein
LIKEHMAAVAKELFRYDVNPTAASALDGFPYSSPPSPPPGGLLLEMILSTPMEGFEAFLARHAPQLRRREDERKNGRGERGRDGEVARAS